MSSSSDKTAGASKVRVAYKVPTLSVLAHHTETRTLAMVTADGGKGMGS